MAKKVLFVVLTLFLAGCTWNRAFAADAEAAAAKPTEAQAIAQQKSVQENEERLQRMRWKLLEQREIMLLEKEMDGQGSDDVRNRLEGLLLQCDQDTTSRPDQDSVACDILKGIQASSVGRVYLLKADVEKLKDKMKKLQKKVDGLAKNCKGACGAGKQVSAKKKPASSAQKRGHGHVAQVEKKSAPKPAAKSCKTCGQGGELVANLVPTLELEPAVAFGPGNIGIAPESGATVELPPAPVTTQAQPQAFPGMPTLTPARSE